MSDVLKTQAMNTELYEYKQKVISLLLSSSEIVEGLNADVDSSELIYENVFPFAVVPTTQTETKCYITVEVSMPQVSTVNYFFKDVLLTVNVICHNSLMKTDYGIPRHDYLSAKICELLNGNADFGYGEMELVSNIEGPYSEKHSYRAMRFQTQEQAKSNLCT